MGSEKISALAEIKSEDAHQSISANGDHTDNLSSETSDEDRRIKEIEEYPRPLAVVGVSVL